MQGFNNYGCPPGTVGQILPGGTYDGTAVACVAVVSAPAWYDQYESPSYIALAVGLVLYGIVLAILRSTGELPAIQMPELVEYGRYEVHQKGDDDDE